MGNSLASHSTDLWRGVNDFLTGYRQPVGSTFCRYWPSTLPGGS